MKAFLLAVTLVTLVSVETKHLSSGDAMKLFRHQQVCQAKSGVDEKVIEQSKTAEKIEDPKMRQYILCLSTRYGFQDKAGEFQIDVIKAKLDKYNDDKALVEKILATCVVKKETAEDSAVAYFLCYRDNSPKNHDVYIHIPDLSEEYQKKLKQYKDECVKETGLKSEMLAEIEKGNYPDDPVLKQYVLCVSKRVGIQNPEGKLDEKIARDKLACVLRDSDNVENVIKLCLRERDNPEETAYQMLKCVHEKFYFNLLNQTFSAKQQEVKKILESHETCKAVSGILPEEVDEARKGNFPQTDTFKKHLLCIYHKCDVIDDKGVLNKKNFFDKFEKVVDKDIAERVYEKCKNDNDTPENNSYKTFTCFLDTIPYAINFFTLV